jgi:hypothetical protein
MASFRQNWKRDFAGSMGPLAGTELGSFRQFLGDWGEGLGRGAGNQGFEGSAEWEGGGFQGFSTKASR